MQEEHCIGIPGIQSNNKRIMGKISIIRLNLLNFSASFCVENFCQGDSLKMDLQGSNLILLCCIHQKFISLEVL